MLSPIFFLLFFLVIIFGTVILKRIVEKKWGYTEQREKELEKEPGKKPEKERQI